MLLYNQFKGNNKIKKTNQKENKEMKKEFIKNNNLTGMVREHVIEEQRR